MSRVAFLSVPAYGHVNPSLPVVTELVRRGETVFYTATEEFRPHVEEAGASFRAYRGFQMPDEASLTGHPLRLAAAMARMAQTLIPEVLDLLRQDRPDYLIHDGMNLAGKVAARVLDLPAIASIPIFAMSTSNRRPTWGELSGMIRLSLTGLPHVVRFQRLAAAIGRSFDVPPPSLTDIFNNRQPLNIVYTSREFQPAGDTFDDSYRFVGPCLRPDPDPGDFPLDRLDRASTLYISLGTLLYRRPGFYRLCLEALRDYPGTVVMSVGRATDIETLGPLPDHVFARPHVPQIPVLRRTALFITHAGMNSVHEALYHDVPLLLFPQSYEQNDVADRVVALGAGRRLPERDLTPDSLRAAVDAALADPDLRLGCHRLGETFRAAGGAPAAAAAILAFKAQRGL